MRCKAVYRASTGSRVLIEDNKHVAAAIAVTYTGTNQFTQLAQKRVRDLMYSVGGVFCELAPRWKLAPPTEADWV